MSKESFVVCEMARSVDPSGPALSAGGISDNISAQLSIVTLKFPNLYIAIGSGE